MGRNNFKNTPPKVDRKAVILPRTISNSRTTPKPQEKDIIRSFSFPTTTVNDTFVNQVMAIAIKTKSKVEPIMGMDMKTGKISVSAVDITAATEEQIEQARA